MFLFFDTCVSSTGCLAIYILRFNVQDTTLAFSMTGHFFSLTEWIFVGKQTFNFSQTSAFLSFTSYFDTFGVLDYWLVKLKSSWSMTLASESFKDFNIDLICESFTSFEQYDKYLHALIQYNTASSIRGPINWSSWLVCTDGLKLGSGSGWWLKWYQPINQFWA